MKTTLQKIENELLVNRQLAHATDAPPQATHIAKIMVGFLSTFLGDVQLERTRGKAMNEMDVIALVKKYRANAQTVHDALVRDTPEGTIGGKKTEATACELGYWGEVLPQQMSDAELRVEAMLTFESGATNKGLLMKVMKERHGGKYDGRQLAIVVDEILAQ